MSGDLLMRRRTTRELLERIQTTIGTLGELRSQLGLSAAGEPGKPGYARALHDAFVNYTLSTASGFRQATLRPLAPDTVWVDMPTGDSFRVAEVSRDEAGSWRRAFPDFREQTLNVIGNEDYVVIERLSSGTHLNALEEAGHVVGATGRRFQLSEADVVSVGGGSVRRIEDYYDTAAMLRGLGLMPDTPMGHDERAGTPAPVLHASGFLPLNRELRRAGEWPIRQGTAISIGSARSDKAQRNMANCLAIHAAFVNHQPERFEELIAPDAVWIDVPTGEILAAAAAAAHHDHGNWQTAFPDSSAEVTNMVGNEDWVVVQHRGFGTHNGPLVLGGQVYEPTGRSIDIRVLDVVQYRDGRAVLIRNYYDVGMMLVQLGILPDDRHG